MGRGGFEPPKAKPTDLQSVPFGHSGTSPDKWGIVPHKFFETGVLTPQPLKIPLFTPRHHSSDTPTDGAGKGTRTPDLLITNQLLYQLSYASSTYGKTVILLTSFHFCQQKTKKFKNF